MVPLDSTLEVIDAIYAAALEPDGWLAPLELIRSLLDAKAVGIRNQVAGCGVTQTWIGLEPTFNDAYVQRYWQQDPWVAPASQLAVGEAGASHGLLAPESLRASEFYNELCLPHELGDLVGGVIDREPDRFITFGVMRPVRSKLFDRESAQVLERFLPHLRRALRVEREIAQARCGADLAWDVIERLSVGVIAVDRGGRVLRANRAAARLFEDALTIDRGVLGARSTTTAAALRCAIARALDPASLMLGAPLDVVIPHPDDSLPSRATVLPSGRGLDGAAKYALVVVTDACSAAGPSASLLARMFGLTPAEARVASLVAAGLAPKEIACKLHVSWNTVRAQLRQIFDKTGTANQAALAKLLVVLGVVST